MVGVANPDVLGLVEPPALTVNKDAVTAADTEAVEDPLTEADPGKPGPAPALPVTVREEVVVVEGLNEKEEARDGEETGEKEPNLLLAVGESDAE